MVRKTVLLDDDMVKELNILSRKEDRDFSSSLRYSVRIGLLALQNPDFTIHELQDILEARAELKEGHVSELNLADL